MGNNSKFVILCALISSLLMACDGVKSKNDSSTQSSVAASAASNPAPKKYVSNMSADKRYLVWGEGGVDLVDFTRHEDQMLETDEEKALFNKLVLAVTVNNAFIENTLSKVPTADERILPVVKMVSGLSLKDVDELLHEYRLRTDEFILNNLKVTSLSIIKPKEDGGELRFYKHVVIPLQYIKVFFPEKSSDFDRFMKKEMKVIKGDNIDYPENELFEKLLERWSGKTYSEILELAK